MKIVIGLLTIFFLFVVLTFGSFKAKDELVIKGFYLGMDFKAAKNNCIKIFQEIGLPLKDFEEIMRKVDLSTFIIARTHPEGEAMMEISANQEGQVIRFIFYPECLIRLFKIAKITNEAIVRMLTRNFRVPQLKQDQFDDTLWEYEALQDDKYKLRISVKEGYLTVEAEN